MVILDIASGPLPIRVAPFTGRRFCHFQQDKLGRGKDKFARGDINLTATKIHRIDPLFDGFLQFRLGHLLPLPPKVLVTPAFGREKGTRVAHCRLHRPPSAARSGDLACSLVKFHLRSTHYGGWLCLHHQW
ncbi:MAG: hypothetical protein CM15mP46_3710 [Alphaproteobacteria bacterium]|nr:MAG: hypothetical protein CM15mP46_3710 [Alphaproteobacteria bacterium]